MFYTSQFVDLITYI